MKAMILSHLKNSWVNHRTTFFATIIAMSLVLCSLSAILLARQNLIVMANTWGQDSELTAYIDDNLDDKKILELQEKIAQIPEVENAKFISKVESAERFLKKMGHLSPDFLGEGKADDNPLPPTVDVHLKAGISLGDRMARLKEVALKVSEISGVQDVSYGQGWLSQWSNFVRKFNILTLAFTLVVLMLGMLVIGNAIRVSLQARQDEIEILELVGATSSWIRGPFIFEGLLIGFISGVLSLILSGVFNSLIFGYMSEAGWMWVNPSQLHLSLTSSFFVLIVGVLFGGLGAYLCVRRLNSGWAAGVTVD